MKLGILFSGGKDSAYAAFTEKKKGNELACLISIFSKNPNSYMFHTPNIKLVKKQAQVMNLPLVTKTTKGIKEQELKDLEEVINLAKKKYKIDGIASGAIASSYQKSRIESICKKLNLKSLTPLWNKDEIEYLNELINNKFKIIITGVAAYPLDKLWLGREINKQFINEVQKLKEKYKIHPAGEGGEFESFVLDCPLFERPLKLKNSKISGEKNSWKIDINVV